MISPDDGCCPQIDDGIGHLAVCHAFSFAQKFGFRTTCLAHPCPKFCDLGWQRDLEDLGSQEYVLSVAVEQEEMHLPGQAAGCVPCFPHDPLERPLQENCIQILDATAAEAIDLIVAALRWQAGVRINKIRKRKFWVSFTACSMGAFCDAKVYVYQQQHERCSTRERPAGHQAGALLAAFQRRHGNAHVFNAVLQRTGERFACKGYDPTSASRLPNSQHVFLTEDVFGSSPGTALALEDIAPLLDMVHTAGAGTGCTETRIQIVVGLQAAIGERDARMAIELCKPEAQPILESLLAAKDFRISYHAAQLISAITSIPEVCNTLMELGSRLSWLPGLVFSTLNVLAIDGNVKSELASVVHMLVQHVADDSQVAGLADALESLLELQVANMPCEMEARHQLEQSLVVLRCKRSMH